jgi:unsaturated rhamnogalacturonyl hydrolase
MTEETGTTDRRMTPAELCVRLYDHYASIAEQVYHYQGLLGIYGLCRTADRTGDTVLLTRCGEILSAFPDHIEHSKYNFPSYTIGGIPRAFMLMRGHMTDPATRDCVRDYAEEMMAAPRDRRGILCNPHQPEAQKIWIDVAMAATPYLLFAGLAFDERRYIGEAVNQTALMYDEFRNPDNGLLHQCRNFVGPGLYSSDHWGRGNGWGFIAATELVQYLPADAPGRPAAEKLFIDHARAMLGLQSSRGLWRQELPMASAWEESSATGLILYGYGVGMLTGVLEASEFGEAFDRGIAALVHWGINDEFGTELCCPGCLCPGSGQRKGTPEAYVEDKQPATDDPHGFGPIILALDAAARRGMTTVEI